MVMRKSLSVFGAVALVLTVMWLDSPEDQHRFDLSGEALPPSTFALSVPTTVPPPTTSTTTSTVQRVPRTTVKRSTSRPASVSAPAPSGSVEAAIMRWFPDMYDKAYRVARCESGLNPQAVSRTSDRGLFQLNKVHAGSFARVTGHPYYNDVFNPSLNAQFARWLYNQSGSWRAWACRGA